MYGVIRRAAFMALLTAGILNPVTDVYASPVVKGIVYDTSGALLKSVSIEVTATDSAGRTIGSATSSMTDGTFTVTFTGTAKNDNLMNVTFRRKRGEGSLTYNNLSWTATTQILCPIVPNARQLTNFDGDRKGFKNRIDAELGEVRRHPFHDEKMGIVVPFKLDSTGFGGKLPSQINVIVWLDNKFAKDWAIVDLEGKPKGAEKEMDPPPYLLIGEKKQPEGQKTWFLEDLKDTNPYEFRVFLKPRGKARPNPAVAIEEMKYKKKLAVYFLSK